MAQGKLLEFVFMVVAFLCFCVAAYGKETARLVAAGLAFWIITLILPW